ncbi:unnamed protein product [Echinostoma caproni]|uniref:Fibronectin type-III domain-containing protein n=1 Tax=Echinostoma caproni TaxID=27848 RepID=A0A183B199_9TREM|nr:unnamed protein product [Echinostoma caproni]
MGGWLRVGGSKRFADSSGVMRTLEFPARSVSVAYASIHSGYTYTVSDLEPNSVYDVQLSAYYEMTLDMESNWETTSCYTQMQKVHPISHDDARLLNLLVDMLLQT